MTTRPILALAAALSWALMVSCGEDARGPVGLACQVADSAGIEVAANQRLSAEPPSIRAVGTSPLVVLGGGATETEGSPQLSRVRDALRLSDGRVIVADGGSARMVVFDAAGRHSATWGRRGEGPGEFTGLAKVARWRGDSIAAWDMWQNRVSIFDSAGVHGRSFRLLPDEDAPPRVVDVRADGAILAMTLPIVSSAERVSGLVRRDRTYVLLNETGHRETSIGVFPGSEGYVDYEGDMLMSWRLPFGRSTVAAFWNDQVLVATNDRYEMRSYAADGTLRRLVRRQHDPIAPTQADLDAHVEALLANLPAEERALQVASAARLPLVDAYPAYAGVAVDAEGRLWVEEYRPRGEEPRTWTVFDGRGCVAEVVDVPDELEVWEIGGDYVLGKATDELGIEQVQVWPLSQVGELGDAVP